MNIIVGQGCVRWSITMEIRRGLLTQGNQKLGEALHVWSLPAIKACPGSSELCRSVCYAAHGRYRFKAVQQRLELNYELSLRKDFTSRMVNEIKRKGVLVVRVHGSGDFYDSEYAEKWLWIMKRQPKPRYYFYTRSWRVPEIAKVIEKIAKLKQVRPWYSVDDETGVPDKIPKRVRIAYLQADLKSPGFTPDLLFRTRRLRKMPLPRIGLTVLPVCPNEAKPKSDVTCGSCQKCFS